MGLTENYFRSNAERRHIRGEEMDIAKSQLKDVASRLFGDGVAESMKEFRNILALSSSIRPHLQNILNGSEEEVTNICLTIAKENLPFLPEYLREDGSRASDKMRAAYVYQCAVLLSESEN